MENLKPFAADTPRCWPHAYNSRFNKDVLAADFLLIVGIFLCIMAMSY